MNVEFDNALNDAGLAMIDEMRKYGDFDWGVFNNIKPCLKVAIEKYLEEKEKEGK